MIALSRRARCTTSQTVRTTCVCLLFGVSVIAACGDDGGGGGGQIDAPSAAIDAAPDAAPRQIVMETKNVLSTQILEATLTGGKLDRAVITLTAPLPKLDWNLHGHAGNGTQTVKEELAVMTSTYEFIPPQQAQWSLLIRNQHTAPMDVQVKIELFGNMQWGGWQ